jgi:hypothetical protein
MFSQVHWRDERAFGSPAGTLYVVEDHQKSSVSSCTKLNGTKTQCHFLNIKKDEALAAEQVEVQVSPMVLDNFQVVFI